MAIEYAVVVGAAVLLLTVPALLHRFASGPIGFHDVPPDVYEAVYLFAHMAPFALFIGYIIYLRMGWRHVGMRLDRWRSGLMEGIALGGLIIGVDILWALGTGEPVTAPVRAHVMWNVALTVLAAFWIVAMVASCTAEEVLRAYVVRRGEDLGWGTPFAAFLSIFLFFSYHTFYIQSVLFIVTLTGGVLLTAYYVFRRNLIGLIVAHLAANLGWLATAL